MHHLKIRNSRCALSAITLAILVMLPISTVADTTDTTTYGSGNYGNCNYGACSITLSSNGAVSVDVTPTGSGSCTIQKDDVSVLTDNSTGYTLQITTSTTATAMTSGGNSVATSSGTPASPMTLANNTWGYRVDSTFGFGSGPTSAQSNVTTPSLTFSGVPASNQTPNTLVNASSAADPAVDTPVWYGLCANSTQASGTYTVQVTYTAVTN